MGYNDDYDEKAYWYSYYSSKYSECCCEIGSCQDRLYIYNNERQKVVNRITKLKTDIKNTQTAIDGLTKAINSEQNLNSKLGVVGRKTEQATLNYVGMVKASDVTSKRLTDVYSNETTKTKSTLTNVLSTLRSRKSTLNTKLAELKGDLAKANTELQNLDNNISKEKSNISYWSAQKTSYYYNMQCYS